VGVWSQRTVHTHAIRAFDKDLESFLGVEATNVREDLKPVRLLSYLQNGRIDAGRIDALREVVESVLPAA